MTKETKHPKVYVLSKEVLKAANVSKTAFIALEELGFYGFTSDIIEDMTEFDIFPKIYKIGNKIVVNKTDIFETVQQLLRKSMAIYRAVDEGERAKKELQENALPIEELVKP